MLTTFARPVGRYHAKECRRILVELRNVTLLVNEVFVGMHKGREVAALLHRRSTPPLFTHLKMQPITTIISTLIFLPTALAASGYGPAYKPGVAPEVKDDCPVDRLGWYVCAHSGMHVVSYFSEPSLAMC
jgi:hypothetical protein